MVGRREPRTSGKGCMGIVDHRFEHIDSGRFASTGHFAAVPRRGRGTCTSRPHTGAAPIRGLVAVPSSSGHERLPVGTMSGVTPNTSHSVACRSTVVVSARRARRDARPRHQQRDVARARVDRHLRLAPHAALAEVVAVVGAEDHRRGVPCVAAIDHVEDPTEPVVDHRELGAVLRPQMRASRRRGCRIRRRGVGGVRRPDQALPSGRRRTASPTARACRTARADRTRRRTSSERSSGRRSALSSRSSQAAAACIVRGPGKSALVAEPRARVS